MDGSSASLAARDRRGDEPGGPATPKPPVEVGRNRSRRRLDRPPSNGGQSLAQDGRVTFPGVRRKVRRLLTHQWAGKEGCGESGWLVYGSFRGHFGYSAVVTKEGEMESVW